MAPSIPCRWERDLPLSVTGRLGVLAGDGGVYHFVAAGVQNRSNRACSRWAHRYWETGRRGPPWKGKLAGGPLEYSDKSIRAPSTTNSQSG